MLYFCDDAKFVDTSALLDDPACACNQGGPHLAAERQLDQAQAQERDEPQGNAATHEPPTFTAASRLMQTQCMQP